MEIFKPFVNSNPTQGLDPNSKKKTLIEEAWELKLKKEKGGIAHRST